MDDFDRVFKDIPAGRTTVRHWAKQDRALLNRAARMIEALGANPWCFVADGRHFEQFSGEPEYDVLKALTYDERDALIYWDKYYWDSV